MNIFFKNSQYKIFTNNFFFNYFIINNLTDEKYKNFNSFGFFKISSLSRKPKIFGFLILNYFNFFFSLNFFFFKNNFFFKNTSVLKINIMSHLFFWKTRIFINVNKNVFNYFKFYYVNNFFYFTKTNNYINNLNTLIFKTLYFKPLSIVLKKKNITSLSKYHHNLSSLFFFNFYKNYQKHYLNPNNTFKSDKILNSLLNYLKLFFSNNKNFKKLKFFRKLKKKNLNIFLFLSKIFFSNNQFNRNLLKKYKTHTFYITPTDLTSYNLIRIYTSSSFLDEFEYKKFTFFFHKSFQTTNIFTQKIIYFTNLANFKENIFFEKFEKKKKFFPFFSKKFKLNFLNLLFNKNYLFSSNSNGFLELQTYKYLNSFNEYAAFNGNFFFEKKPKIFKNFNNNFVMNFFNKKKSKDSFLFFKIWTFNSFMFFFFNSFFFKYFIFFKQINFKTSHISEIYYFFKNYTNSFFFYTFENIFNISNIVPHFSFFFKLKKKILKMFTYDKFTANITPLYNQSLIRFLEHCSGKKIIIKVNTLLNNILTYEEKTQCLIWAQKVKIFRRMLGPRLFLSESLEILYISLKLKDPFFLSNWLISMMKKISFWKYRLFFRYLKYVLRYFFYTIFEDLTIKGIKFQLKGKISVAGNARTRKIIQKTGSTGHSTFDNKILYQLSLIRTFTGVIGLKVWIVF